MCLAARLALVPACVCVSVALTWALRGLARRRHLLDHPNERSAHTVPTPRLGGIGILLPFWAAAGGALVASGRGTTAELAVAVGMAAMAVLGLVDDVRPVAARWKLLLQLAAAVLVVATVGETASERLGVLGRLLPPAVALPAAVLWIVWVTNLYNFMDGIDGIAGGQTILAATAIAAGAFGMGNSELGWLLVFLAASSAGFLLFNFPPGSIFMGDAGSTAIGFFLASVPLLPAAGTLPFETVAMAISLFVLDATITLLRRMVRGERWFAAHRTHFYQRPLAFGIRHRPITLTAYAGMAVAGAAAAAYPLVERSLRPALVAVPLLVFAALAGVVVCIERSHRSGHAVQ